MLRIVELGAMDNEDFFENHLKKETPVLFRGAALQWPAIKLWDSKYLCQKLKGFATGVETYERANITDPLHANHANLQQRRMNIPAFFEELEKSTSKISCIVPSKIDLGQYGLMKDIGPPVFPISQVLHSLLKLLVRERNPSLLIAPRGAVTTAHFDHFHNFSTLISGQKKWLLFPPSQKPYLYLPSRLDRNGCKSPVDVINPDLKKFPLFAQSQPLSLSMEKGDVLFLPRHWIHWVETTEFSVSLLNWIPVWSDFLTKKVVTQLLGRTIYGTWTEETSKISLRRLSMHNLLSSFSKERKWSS